MFLIHIRLGGGTPAPKEHIREVATHLKATAKKTSNGECHLAYAQRQ